PHNCLDSRSYPWYSQAGTHSCLPPTLVSDRKASRIVRGGGRQSICQAGLLVCEPAADNVMSIPGAGIITLPPHPPTTNLDPFQSPTPAPAAPRPRSWLWLIALGVVASVCLCSGLCLVPSGLLIYRAAAERQPIEKSLNSFLADLNADRIDKALAHFSSRAQRSAQVNRQQIEQFAKAPYARGCNTTHITQINISQNYNTNQDVPQGTVANVSGTLDYTDGSHGTFRATLEREKGEWR